MTNFLLCLPIILPLFFFAGNLIRKVDDSVFKKLYFVTLFLTVFFASLNIFIFKDLFIDVRFGELSIFYLYSDSLSIVFVIMSSVLWIFVSIYAFGYFGNSKNKHLFFSFFMLAFGATIGMSYSNSLITFYLFYELLSFCSFFMIIYTGTKESFISAKKYITYSLWSSFFIIIGIALLKSKIGCIDFIVGGSINSSMILSKLDILIPYFMLFIGFGIKAALVPLHGWLPESMSAPTPVCALIMEVITVKTSIFALIRITYYVFGWTTIENTIGNNTMLIFVLLNILLGSFLALHQKNLKKRLAYSTISQLGYIMFGLVVFNKDILVGSMLHLVFHSINKVILFLCIGYVIHKTGKTNIDEIAGIGKKMPKTMICFTISAFSLIGIPPANGFMSKWYIATGGISMGQYFVPIFLLLSALLTAEYLVPIITSAFFKGNNNTDDMNYDEFDNQMLYPIICLTAISVITGILPNETIFFIQKAAEALF